MDGVTNLWENRSRNSSPAELRWPSTARENSSSFHTTVERFRQGPRLLLNPGFAGVGSRFVSDQTLENQR